MRNVTHLIVALVLFIMYLWMDPFGWAPLHPFGWAPLHPFGWASLHPFGLVQRIYRNSKIYAYVFSTPDSEKLTSLQNGKYPYLGFLPRFTDEDPYSTWHWKYSSDPSLFRYEYSLYHLDEYPPYARNYSIFVRECIPLWNATFHKVSTHKADARSYIDPELRGGKSLGYLEFPEFYIPAYWIEVNTGNHWIPYVNRSNDQMNAIQDRQTRLLNTVYIPAVLRGCEAQGCVQLTDRGVPIPVIIGPMTVPVYYRNGSFQLDNQDGTPFEHTFYSRYGYHKFDGMNDTQAAEFTLKSWRNHYQRAKRKERLQTLSSVDAQSHPCRFDSCQNGGTCIHPRKGEEYTHYTCECAENFIGDECEIEIHLTNHRCGGRYDYGKDGKFGWQPGQCGTNEACVLGQCSDLENAWKNRMAQLPIFHPIQFDHGPYNDTLFQELFGYPLNYHNWNLYSHPPGVQRLGKHADQAIYFGMDTSLDPNRQNQTLWEQRIQWPKACLTEYYLTLMNLEQQLLKHYSAHWDTDLQTQNHWWSLYDHRPKVDAWGSNPVTPNEIDLCSQGYYVIYEEGVMPLGWITPLGYRWFPLTILKNRNHVWLNRTTHKALQQLTLSDPYVRNQSKDAFGLFGLVEVGHLNFNHYACRAYQITYNPQRGQVYRAASDRIQRVKQQLLRFSDLEFRAEHFD